MAKSPVKASVRVAVDEPEVPPDTLAMDTFGIAVTSSKLEAVTPPPKEVLPSLTVTVALFRVPSVRAAGRVDAIDAPYTRTLKPREARSSSPRLESASAADTLTPQYPVPVGVPQTVRGAVPGQPSASVPVASNVSPDGRPVAV